MKHPATVHQRLVKPGDQVGRRREKNQDRDERSDEVCVNPHGLFEPRDAREGIHIQKENGCQQIVQPQIDQIDRKPDERGEPLRIGNGMNGNDVQGGGGQVDQDHREEQPVVPRGIVALQKIHRCQHDGTDQCGNAVLLNIAHEEPPKFC